ncbi:MAG TPA: MaoC family dehydratase [Ktedonobacterales bacterium]|nr:MaoC family dehydratase [Ktedonobacterales bacterium]
MTEPSEPGMPALPTIGERATRICAFTPEMVAQFAALVGDRNPVHLDAKYAERTPFGHPIVHGMFVASLISGILGERLPGPGSIYLGQTLRFEAPVFVGDTVTASVEVTAVRPEKRIVTLRAECVREDGVRVIAGEAIVKC